MCGLVFSSMALDDAEIQKYQAKISSRGQDQSSTLSRDGNVFMHSRLIITGSATEGRQPFETNSYIFLFNGEIYNIDFLKSLLGKLFQTVKSDTVVLAHAIEMFGIEIIDCFDGPFSIIIYDKHTGDVDCYRDRYGEKPLFFFSTANSIIVSSDLAIIVEKSKAKLDKLLVSKYLKQGFLDGYDTLFEHIKKIKPYKPKYTKFYSEYLTWSTVNGLDSVFAFAVRNVSIDGAALLLSGGVDSTLVAAYCSQQAMIAYTLKLRNDLGSDESNSAKKSAKRLQLPLEVVEKDSAYTKENFLRTIRKLNEPVGDPGIFNQNLIFNEIRKKHKVAIVGTGGDELFFGYLRYRKFFLIKFHNFFYLLRFFIGTERYKKLMNDEAYSMEEDRKNYLPNQLFSATDSIGFNSGVEVRTPFTSILMVDYAANSKLITWVDFLILKRRLKWLLLYKFGINKFFTLKRGFTNDYKNIAHIERLNNLENIHPTSELENLRLKILEYWLDLNSISHDLEN